jgi:hypothetical protein
MLWATYSYSIRLYLLVPLHEFEQTVREVIVVLE